MPTLVTALLSSARGMAGRLAAGTAVFLALAVYVTFPLVLRLETHIPGGLGDPLHIAWILSWVARALVTAPLQMFDANVGYPFDNSLAFSEHMIGVAPLFAVPYLITGNPAFAYNVAVLLSFALSGLSAFCLAYYWTRAFWGSLVAGALITVAPYRLAQVGHFQLQNFFWAPFALLFLDRFLRRRRWRDLAAFAASYWLQCLSAAYLAFLLTTGVGVYAAYHAIAVDRSLLARRMALKVLAFLVASVLVLGPIHLPYFQLSRAWDAYRRLDEIHLFSPSLFNYLSPPPTVNTFYRRLLDFAAEPNMEKRLFPGLVLPILVLVGSCTRLGIVGPFGTRQMRRALWLVGGSAIVLSLGPFVWISAQHGIPLPYLLLYHVVPGWASMRVPARFVLLALVAAAPLAALGALRCCEVASGLFRGRWAWRVSPAVSVGLIVLALLELRIMPVEIVRVPTGTDVPPVYRWLAEERPGPIVELPSSRLGDVRYVFLSTFHWLPLVNFTSSYWPPAYRDVEEALAELPGRRAVEYLAAVGTRAVLVHHGDLPREQQRRWRSREPVDAGLVRRTAFGDDEVYLLPQAPTAASLSGRLSLPDWIAAGEELTVPLALGPTLTEAWVHPRPHGSSLATVHWRNPETGRTIAEDQQRMRLPLVVLPATSSALGIQVIPPAEPGIYSVAVSIPGRNVVIAPQIVEVRATRYPTSRNAEPGFLSASYAHDIPREITATTELSLNVRATNTGRATWLARARGYEGAVRLGWQGRRACVALGNFQGRADLDYDVFPGQSYQFRATIPLPAEPGTYELDLGLVSELVAWFHDLGTPSIQVVIAVSPLAGADKGGLTRGGTLAGR